VFDFADRGQRLLVGLGFNMFLPFFGNYGSASSREVVWERNGRRPPEAKSIEDAAKASEQENKPLREDPLFLYRRI
jgi:hypothetical protein